MCRKIVSARFFVGVASMCNVIRFIPLRPRYRLFLFLAILTRTFGSDLWCFENIVCRLQSKNVQRGIRGGSSCVTCAFRVNFGKFLFVSVNLTPIRADQGRVHYLAQYLLLHRPHSIRHTPSLDPRARIDFHTHVYSSNTYSVLWGKLSRKALTH